MLRFQNPLLYRGPGEFANKSGEAYLTSLALLTVRIQLASGFHRRFIHFRSNPLCPAFGSNELSIEEF